MAINKQYSSLLLSLSMLLVGLLFASTVNGRGSSSLPQLSRPIALKGTIVTPSHVIQNGWVLIENGKISGIFSSHKRVVFPPNTLSVNTKGLIFPGLVDVHNHISFNAFEAWAVGPVKFNNRYAWRYFSTIHESKVKSPYDHLLEQALFCHMSIYGELRAIVGGTTSLIRGKDTCINGLARDLLDPNQVEQRRIESLIDIKDYEPPSIYGDPNDRNVDEDLKNARMKLQAGTLDAFFIHLAEGKSTDAVTKEEFSILEAKGLLTDKTAIVHGISLGPRQFSAMYRKGASLVWSPRSNIALYGETADIAAAKRQRIRIAIAPDWAITGSSNLLEELRYAKQWNERHLGSLLTHKDLVDMVTRIPADIAGLGDKLGSIKLGYFADLLVIAGDPSDPYRSLVQARTSEVKLVVVNGSPLYGEKALMHFFQDQYETVLNTNPAMVLRTPLVVKNPDTNTFDGLQGVLRNAMASQNVGLAPLFDIKIRKGLYPPPRARAESRIPAGCFSEPVQFENFLRQVSFN